MEVASTQCQRQQSRSYGSVGQRTLRKIKEELQCSICLDALNDPRLLECHHSFCLHCLQSMLAVNSRDIKCPNCNETTMLQGPVSELPPDFRANSLLEFSQITVTEQPQVRSPTVVGPPALKSSNNLWGNITCPVCSHIYEEPRQLDCGHTFCTQCVEFMTPNNELVVYCPCCDSKTDVKNGVQGLRLDVAICQYISMITDPGTERVEVFADLERLNGACGSGSGVPPLSPRPGSLRGVDQQPQPQPPPQAIPEPTTTAGDLGSILASGCLFIFCTLLTCCCCCCCCFDCCCDCCDCCCNCCWDN